MINDIIQTIRDIVNNKTPQTDISELLQEHGCMYLLSLFDNGINQKVKLSMILNTVVIRERYNACNNVFKVLESESIPYAVIKGAVLSKQAYGNINYKQSGDTDILIAPDNLNKIKKILKDEAFIQGRVIEDKIVPFTRQELIYQSTFSHQTAPFVKKTDSKICPFINVDINTDIMWGESGVKSDMSFFLNETENIDIQGVTVKKLLPVKEFISLCLHHYKDMNSIYLLSNGSLRLSLFCEIYYYLKNNNLSAYELKQLSEKLKVRDYIYYCICLTNEIFDDPQLLPYLNVLKTDSAQKLINFFGLDDTERKEWNMPFFDRLFSSDFGNNFDKLLTDKDRKKIRINHEMM